MRRDFCNDSGVLRQVFSIDSGHDFIFPLIRAIAIWFVEHIRHFPTSPSTILTCSSHATLRIWNTVHGVLSCWHAISWIARWRMSEWRRYRLDIAKGERWLLLWSLALESNNKQGTYILWLLQPPLYAPCWSIASLTASQNDLFEPQIFSKRKR